MMRNEIKKLLLIYIYISMMYVGHQWFPWCAEFEVNLILIDQGGHSGGVWWCVAGDILVCDISDSDDPISGIQWITSC